MLFHVFRLFTSKIINQGSTKQKSSFHPDSLTAQHMTDTELEMRYKSGTPGSPAWSSQCVQRTDKSTSSGDVQKVYKKESNSWCCRGEGNRRPLMGDNVGREERMGISISRPGHATKGRNWNILHDMSTEYLGRTVRGRAEKWHEARNEELWHPYVGFRL